VPKRQAAAFLTSKVVNNSDPLLAGAMNVFSTAPSSPPAAFARSRWRSSTSPRRG
jgi:hypothetical protein